MNFMIRATIEPYPKKRRRPSGVVTPHSAGTLAFGTCHAEGIVLDKYFFGDRSESVASRFGVPSKYAG